MKQIATIVICIVLSGCAIKIPTSKVEDSIKLAYDYDQDLASEIIRHVDTISVYGKTFESIHKNTKISLKDQESGKSFVIKLNKGTTIEFGLKFTTRKEKNFVYPKIEDFYFESSEPITIKAKGLKLGSFTSLEYDNHDKIIADVNSLAIINLILVYTDYYMLSKNKPNFKLNKACLLYTSDAADE